MRLGVAIAFAVVPALTGHAPGQIAKVTTIQLPDGGEVQEALYEDVNGDGQADLLLAVSRKGQPFDRQLRVHLRKGDKLRPFAQAPDRSISIPRSVTAFAVADVHSDPHAEIVWFGARGVYAYRTRAEERQRVQKLVACEFLFQFADPQRVYSWQKGARDLNGDGLVDLVLPERGGYRIALQKRTDGTVSFASFPLTLPERISPDHRPRGGSRRGGRGSFQPDLGMGKKRPPLVRINDNLPAPQLADWDGDGDLDVIVKHDQEVLVWRQTPKGFAKSADVEIAFPLARDKARLDASFAAWMVDYSGDKRADSVLFTKDRGSDDIRTHVMFFPQRPGTRAPLYNEGKPQQLLVISGFTANPRLQDFDGDGWPDLQVSAWRLDVLDQLQGAESLEIDLYMYRNVKGRFTRQPAFTHKVTLATGALQNGNNGLFARFFSDITGDGVSELLIRDRPERMRLLMVRKSRGGTFSVVTRPLHEMKLRKDARLRPLSQRASRPGLLILESDQLLLVTY